MGYIYQKIMNTMNTIVLSNTLFISPAWISQNPYTKT